MSGDLISRAALLEQYGLKDCTKYGNETAEQQRKSYDTLMMYEIADMIEDAPMAYDMEKVIQTLESAVEYFQGALEELLVAENYGTAAECKGRLKGFKEAIEFVKRGGID